MKNQKLVLKSSKIEVTGKTNEDAKYRIQKKNTQISKNIMNYIH